MELSTLQKHKDDPTVLIRKISALKPKDDDGARNYEPEKHDVTDETKRKKRELKVDTGNVDPVTNEPIMRTEFEEVARITSSAQKLIVSWAVQIAAGVPVELTADPQNDTEKKMLAMLQKTLKDNKMEYLDQEILRLTAIYKRCAEIWYEEQAEEGYWGDLGNSQSKLKMRLTILSEETGDVLIPVKDSKGNMIALGREYVVFDDETEKDVKKFDLFEQNTITTYVQDGAGWAIEGAPVTIKYGKANFIYHEQKKREWEDVQPKINRLETLDSNHADQNDATGSPMLAVRGVAGFSKRGETGKVFELEDGGELKVVESLGAPESVKMERQNLNDGIFDETQTPQISFSKAAGFGQLPGVTLKLMFLPATLKAMARQSGGWGMSIQRRYNFLKSAMAFINVDVKTAVGMDVRPRFSIFIPENTTEKYENIVKLVGAGLLSKEKAIGLLGLVDADEVAEEIKRIEVETKAKEPKKIEE